MFLEPAAVSQPQVGSFAFASILFNIWLYLRPLGHCYLQMVLWWAKLQLDCVGTKKTYSVLKKEEEGMIWVLRRSKMFFLSLSDSVLALHATILSKSMVWVTASLFPTPRWVTWRCRLAWAGGRGRPGVGSDQSCKSSKSFKKVIRAQLPGPE